MTKTEADWEIRALMSVWRTKECADTSRDRLDFAKFYSWLRMHSPVHLRYRSKTGVRNDIKGWFAEEFGRA